MNPSRLIVGIEPTFDDDDDSDSTFPILSNWSPSLSSLSVPANYDTCQPITPVPSSSTLLFVNAIGLVPVAVPIALIRSSVPVPIWTYLQELR
ncbi:hypothetical protein K435DRAFT_74058 [Dendrothele bispora CBS 962.96]|uniref:Uncharacterized protein n=1 Tax=Dendrothele bispora (strain CBS 962.96) TaxID=1314807 RepID=A0A4S8M4B9_DENBC|nr:hypothetical protein K435DRAFT_74058 [Dendrothele bispora CBS 962.96]